VLLGGKRLDRPGYFLEPTILTDIKPENPAYLSGVLRSGSTYLSMSRTRMRRSKLANDSPYGLGGSVITKDTERGKRVARQIERGMVFINKATWTAPDLPFGGVKKLRLWPRTFVTWHWRICK